jgi:hypothetical protein
VAAISLAAGVVNRSLFTRARDFVRAGRFAAMSFAADVIGFFS